MAQTQPALPTTPNWFIYDPFCQQLVVHSPHSQNPTSPMVRTAKTFQTCFVPHT